MIYSYLLSFSASGKVLLFSDLLIRNIALVPVFRLFTLFQQPRVSVSRHPSPLYNVLVDIVEVLLTGPGCPSLGRDDLTDPAPAVGPDVFDLLYIARKVFKLFSCGVEGQDLCRPRRKVGWMLFTEREKD